MVLVRASRARAAPPAGPGIAGSKEARRKAGEERPSVDDRQDGYVRRAVVTVPVSSAIAAVPSETSAGVIGAVVPSPAEALSFSGFLYSLLQPPVGAGCKGDPHVLVPIAAADVRDAALPAADAVSAAAHVNTRSEVRTLSAPASQALKRELGVQLAAQSSDHLSVPGTFGGKRKARSTSPVSADGAAEGASATVPARPSKRGRLSRGRSPSASRSRERSASRAREFQRQMAFTPLTAVWDDEDQPWSSRRRQAKRAEGQGSSGDASSASSSDEDDDCEPSAFSAVLKYRRPFMRRMGRERVRVSDLIADFGYEVRLDEDDAEQQHIHDAVIADADSDDSSVDHQRRSRRDRHRRAHTDWMRPDNAFVRHDIDRIRKALTSDDAYAQAMALPMPLPSAASPPSSTAGSPVAIGSPTTFGSESPALVPTVVSPPSPVFSLVSVSPPSSRSASPVRTVSRSRSPRRDASSTVFTFDKPSVLTYHSPPVLAAISPDKATALAQRAFTDPPPSVYLVEAILDHRPVQQTSAAVRDWASEWQQWRRGVQFEYSVRWLGWTEPTWEPHAGVGDWLVEQYWHGHGMELWTEQDIQGLIATQQQMDCGVRVGPLNGAVHPPSSRTPSNSAPLTGV